MWVAGVRLAVASLVHLFHTAGILRRDLATRRRIADGGQVWANTWGIVLTCGSLRRFGRLTVDGASPLRGSCSLLFRFPLAVLLLLPRLPLLSDLLEFCIADSSQHRAKLVSRGLEVWGVVPNVKKIRLMLCNMTRKARPNRKRDDATVKTMRLTFRSTLLPM